MCIHRFFGAPWLALAAPKCGAGRWSAADYGYGGWSVPPENFRKKSQYFRPRGHHAKSSETSHDAGMYVICSTKYVGGVGRKSTLLCSINREAELPRIENKVSLFSLFSLARR